MKLYVQEIKSKTVDGDEVVQVKVHKSKPRTFSYIVFEKK